MGEKAKIGAFGGMGLHFGGFGVNLGVLLAREPLNMRVNPLMRTQAPQHAPGRHCPRAGHRAHVRVQGATCELKGPRAGHRAHVRVKGSTCMSSGPRARKGARVGLRCLARADCVAVIAIVRGSDGSWARLLAVLTLQGAAKPHWWHGGQPAQVTTYRVNVRIGGPTLHLAG